MSTGSGDSSPLQPCACVHGFKVGDAKLDQVTREEKYLKVVDILNKTKGEGRCPAGLDGHQVRLHNVVDVAQDTYVNGALCIFFCLGEPEGTPSLEAQSEATSSRGRHK